MSDPISSFVQKPGEDIETEQRRMFTHLVKMANAQKKLTNTWYIHFLSLDPEGLEELEGAFKELVNVIQNNVYYTVLERIEKGEMMYAKETDPERKRYYRQLLDGLITELEKLIPQEVSA